MKLRELSIATFNLLNFNLPGHPIYDNATGWSQEVYDRKVAFIAGQVRLLDADIFGFQELWHPDALAAVVAAAGMTDTHDVLTEPGSSGQHISCAALVRKGLLTGKPRYIADFPDGFILKSSGDDPQTPAIEVGIKGFSRPVLNFQILPRSDAPPIDIYVCHLKSKAPTQVFTEKWYKADKPLYSKHGTALGSALSTIRRTAEAAALRFILTEAMKGNDKPVIILGDLNDSQTSNTASVLTGQPRYLVGDSVGGGDTALYTAQTLQEYRDTRDVYYTYVHDDMRESLDHIMVSQEFYDNSKKRLWLFDGLTINNDHLNVDDHKMSGTTDHGVVKARFKYKPIKVEAKAMLEG